MSDLASIRTFPQLVRYLRDELDWPITSDDFEDLFFDFTPQELGIDTKNAAKIQQIKRLRSLSVNQPWGVFFVKFEPKRLPIVALRRILSSVALRRRASSNSAERRAWEAEDLLFISNYGIEGDGRQITFAHFSQNPGKGDLPTLKVLGWDNLDTPLHIDHVASTLHEHLLWPHDEANVQMWRAEWSRAFDLRYREVITTSRSLAIRLAELARAIRNRINAALQIETDEGPLTTLMGAFREALVHDLDGDGFADMYAQTIAYGLLSTRIANPKADTADGLAAQMPVTNPFLRELMETFLQVGGRRGEDAATGASLDFDELGVSEVVDLLDRANMEVVLRDFGDRNPQEDPVIHFYELFLQEYDSKKRMQRGVFYTPRPVVSHIVRSIHAQLQSEFRLPDGLADTSTWGEMAARLDGVVIPEQVEATDRFVTVLDPATGTGTFLVEVIAVIHSTLSDKWSRAGCDPQRINELWNDYVPEHLLPRLHGYEILMAPYAIAHLKVGLKLRETGYLFESAERARIFLTNALEPAHDFSDHLEFTIPALAHEARDVNRVKSMQRFTVVTGNPPYSSVSQNMGAYIWGLVNEYLSSEDGPIEERGNRNHLQDDYVKFIRLGQLLISRAGIGVVAYITNSSYLVGAWYRGMRWHLTQAFASISVLDLHGGKGFVRSVSDDDQNVFDILQSVAIALFVLKPDASHTVRYAELRGSRSYKYDRLLATEAAQSDVVAPSAGNLWSFAPTSSDPHAEWLGWPSMPDIFLDWGAGVATNRDGLATGFSADELATHIRDFADLNISDGEIESRYGFGSNYTWTTRDVRRRFAAHGYDPALVTPYQYRPFDQRLVYWHPMIVFNMRGGKMDAFRRKPPPGGLLFSRATMQDAYTNFYVTRAVPDRQCAYNVNAAPLFRATEPANGPGLFEDVEESNLAPDFIARVASGFSDKPASSPTSHEIFHYAYAVFTSSTYRERYYEDLVRDFPRLPLTGQRDLFGELARLGAELVSYHLMEAERQRGVTAAFDEKTRSWRVDVVGMPTKEAPSFEGAMSPTVGQPAWFDGTVWIDAAKPRGWGAGDPIHGTAGFHNVPEDVWKFAVGGFQVCHKWLKDRRGRTLSAEEVSHYCKIVIALRETIRITREIDDVIDAYGGWPGAFATESTVPLPEARADYSEVLAGEELLVADAPDEAE